MENSVNRVLFNDIEPFVCRWLQHLFPKATVDARSITDLVAADVRDFNRVHLFAGIGGWELALNLAGWPAQDVVWTGSCPCQPFSVAGKHGGKDDSRHLWPQMLRLIEQCQPPTIFGEQVASRAGREWLSGVRADLEALGYVVGAADLCAASVGAPHIRQRLYWGATTVANAHQQKQGRRLELQPRNDEEEDGARTRYRSGRSNGLPTVRVGDTNSEQTDAAEPRQQMSSTGRAVVARNESASRATSEIRSFWDEADLVVCNDGNLRRIEPGVFPLADGVPARVGRLRGYGNAIVPPLAAVFIKAFREAVYEA